MPTARCSPGLNGQFRLLVLLRCQTAPSPRSLAKPRGRLREKTIKSSFFRLGQTVPPPAVGARVPPAHYTGDRFRDSATTTKPRLWAQAPSPAVARQLTLQNRASLPPAPCRNLHGCPSVALLLHCSPETGFQVLPSHPHCYPMVEASQACGECPCKSLKLMVPAAGFEPATP